MANKLFVGGLPWAVDDGQLQDHFAQFGEIREAKVIYDRETGRSRGFGFVTYVADEDAQKARELDGSDFGGRTIRVDFARERSRDGF